MKITEFDIRLSEEKILSMLDIMEGKEEEIAKRLHEALPEIMEHFRPTALYEIAREALYVLLTLGGEITRWSNELLEKGEYVKSLLADTAANAYLFAMDESMSDTIRNVCIEHKKGIAARLEAPENMPIFMQKKILEVTDAEKLAGVTITQGMMYDPVKTMGQVYLLSDDTSVFQNCHTCEGCSNLTCPSRKR